MNPVELLRRQGWDVRELPQGGGWVAERKGRAAWGPDPGRLLLRVIHLQERS